VPKHQASGHGAAAAAGATLIVLAFLVGVSLFPHQTATVPRFIAARGGQLFGRGLWAVPIVFLVFGLVFVIRRNFALSARLWGVLTAYLVTLVALHLQYAGRELLAALGRKGGGYAGALLSLVLRRTTGEPGLWLAVAGGAAAAALLLSGRTADDLAQIGLASFVIAGRAAAAAARAVAAWLGTALLWIGRAVVSAAATLLAFITRFVRNGVPVLYRSTAHAGTRLAALIRSAAQPAVWPHLGGTVEAVATAAPAPATAPLPVVAIAPQAVTGATPLADGLEDASDLVEAGPATAEATGELPDTLAGPKRQRRRRSTITQESLPFPLEPARAYVVPDLSLLDAYGAKAKAGKVDPDEVARNLERALASFGVEAKVVRWETGPVVTRYELQPAPGVKVQKITSLQSDIALALAASSVRLEAPIPGKSAIGVELPNERPSLVHLREILASEEFARATSPLAVAVGKGIAGTPIIADLVQMPHLLIAGATGAGKSVALNAMIASILFRSTPEQIRFLMIDPKRVELTNYNGIPHLLSPVVTGPREAAAKLRWAIQEMESRYEMFAAEGVRNIQAFNAAHSDRPLGYIVIIIDELADLMMVAPADFEEIICRLAQMTRATGIHLLVATQRPSVDVITGLIKANIPSRIAFSVSSQVDSRTILDHPGAEKLLGRGDMLFSPLGATRPVRVQGAFISDAETERLVQFWRTQGEPAYVDALLQAAAETGEEAPAADALLADAARLVVRAGYASVSLLQRKMRIGYVRAARLVDQLEERGIVGPSQGSSPRELLVGLEELDRVLRAGPAQPAAP
jgi:hypothetical protein